MQDLTEGQKGLAAVCIINRPSKQTKTEKAEVNKPSSESLPASVHFYVHSLLINICWQ